MNIFTFLKSRTGALSKVGVISLGLTTGLVGLNFYNYVTSSPAAQEQKVRNLASILAAGGEVPVEYSSINVGAGGTHFATAEERAKYEGAIFDGGDAAEARLNGFNIQGRALGAGEDGLGTGGVDAVEVGTRGSVGVGNMPDGSAVGAAVRSGAENQGANARASQFQRASMAQAGGSNLGAGGSGSFSYSRGGDSATARALKSEGNTRVTPSSISGAMPGGSTLVSSRGFQGAHASSYRDSRGGSFGGQGINSTEGKGLRRIAVNSGKVAADKYRTTNAGTDPFLNDTYESPGTTVTTGALDALSTSGIGNDEFNNLANHRLNRLNDATEDLRNTEKERENDRGRLWKTLIGLTFATFAAMLSIQVLTKMGGFWGWAGAVAVAAVMAIAIGIFVRDAIGYGNKYNEWGIPTVMFAGAAIMVGGLAVSFIKSINGWLGKVSEWFGESFGGDLVKTLIGGGATMGVGQTFQNIESGSIKADDSDKLSNN